MQTLTPMDWALVAVVVVCAITDLTRNRIYNPITYAAMIAGFAFACAGHGPRTLSGTIVDGFESFYGLLVGFVPFFALFVLRGIGGGDVKLMTAIGTIKGPGFVAYTMLYAVFLGAAIGVAITAWRGQLLPILKRVGYTILHTITPGVGPVSHLDARGPKVNFGFAICLATLLALVGQVYGRQLLDL